MAGIFDADFLRGFHLGKAYRANLLRAASKGEPVAYLYGEIRAPKLPDAVSKYSFAHLFPSGALYLLNKPYMRCTGDSGGDVFAINGQKGSSETVSGIPYSLSEDGTSWERRLGFGGYVEWTDYDAGMIFTVTAPAWTNYNVINVDDNSVYFPASDPIPVYE